MLMEEPINVYIHVIWPWMIPNFCTITDIECLNTILKVYPFLMKIDKIIDTIVIFC